MRILSSEEQTEYNNFIRQAETFIRYRQWQDALLFYKRALSICPTSIEALIGIGKIYQNTEQFHKAILTFHRIIELQRDDTPLFIRVALLELEKRCVSWDTIQQSFDFFNNDEILSYGELPPFVALSNPLTNRQLQIVAQSSLKKNRGLGVKLSTFNFSDRKKDQKLLRIGFMCGDFRSHPTGFLLSEFFELIDRKNFDVFLYDTHPDANDPVHKRIYATTKNTVAIDKINDKEAAQRIFDDKIDVLIDLSGHTKYHRLGVLTYQPAVAQATYSGFPGTCGRIPGLDYILADEYVIPPDQKKFFDETVKYLTPTYRVMDRKQDLPMATLMRKHLHFDQDTIVLCCFNNSYKYTPNYFDLWARILKRVPKAILWFYRQNNYLESNILKEFEKRNIQDKVVFADSVPHAEHLMRYQVADLFLDTENYNAHTTGAEALFMGCPLITCPGNTFASRVGGTMLKALELDELICKNIKEYEEKVVELCNVPGKLKKLREKTIEKIKTAPLFDMEKFTRSFEQNCREMFEENLKVMNLNGNK